ncbi:MAG TPA: fluoride efflux transporter CrcB [Pseudonocardia sp.]|uniref:fluoride efflux transporter CrcB n=1 Tax=Pseudonocardia sp. TaxID=60912 RepID=UPI002B4B1AB7|nr:fluoride efflux transporter CrcB [Pseudonocardia sp.]HLU59931.1 fluoride efflux transporter CrcB [Pseudonocardia sp.]
MTVASVLWVAVGAAVGAPLRYLVDQAVKARYRGRFPWGTFAVNVAGSAVLGALTGAVAALPPGAVPEAVRAGLGVGFCGALTTYSTFGYETLALVEGRATRVAVANLVGSVVAGLLVAGVAWWGVGLVLG